MDPFSQGLTGAVLAQSSSKKDIRLAALAGFAGGMLADLDVLIISSSDPLLNLDFHRHFTHSLLFIPVGGLITALLLWLLLQKVLRKETAFFTLYCFATLGYATAGLLDACTSYGTHLYWPFSDQRVAWNIISIVDPIYTSMLLIGVLVALIRKQPKIARVALVLAMVYLSLGWVQRERAQTMLETVAEQRGEIIERSEVKPTMGNLLLWRGVYQSGDIYRVDAYRLNFIEGNQFYAGDSRQVFDLQRDLPELNQNSTLAEDIRRFKHFSDGFLVRDIDNPDVIGDLRYSMLPTSAKPLWGIVMDLEKQEQHVQFENFREFSLVQRQRFLDMLLGHELVN